MPAQRRQHFRLGQRAVALDDKNLVPVGQVFEQLAAQELEPGGLLGDQIGLHHVARMQEGVEHQPERAVAQHVFGLAAVLELELHGFRLAESVESCIQRAQQLVERDVEETQQAQRLRPAA